MEFDLMSFLTSNWDKLIGLFLSARKKISKFFLRDKVKITELKKEIREKNWTIEKLSDINNELERQNKIMDKVPEGCELIHNNILFHKKTGMRYCWNCWNKLKGRERRVLTDNEYSIRCNVCGVSTQLKNPPRQADGDYDVLK